MIFVKISQSFIKSPLKFCFISQISVHSLWHVCNLIELGDLIGFGYDLSDTQDGLKCWRMGFIFCFNILSS